MTRYIDPNIPRAPEYKDQPPGETDWMENFFTGEDVFIVGGGPSLIGFDFKALEGCRTIGVNWAFRFMTPEVLCFIDREFITECGFDVRNAPFRVVGGNGAGVPGSGTLTILRLTKGEFRTGIPGRSSGGMMAAALAIKLGAARVFLLGLDYCFGGREELQKLWEYSIDLPCYDSGVILESLMESGISGKRLGHFFSGRVKTTHDSLDHKRDNDEHAYARNIEEGRFEPLRPYADKIFNLSPISALTMFPKMHIAEALGYEQNRRTDSGAGRLEGVTR